MTTWSFLFERFIDITVLLIGISVSWILTTKIFRKIYIKKLPKYVPHLIPIIFTALIGGYVYYFFPLFPSTQFTLATFGVSFLLGTWYSIVNLTVTPFLSEDPLENALQYITEIIRPIERGNSKCDKCGSENQNTYEVKGYLLCSECNDTREKTISKLSKDLTVLIEFEKIQVV